MKKITLLLLITTFNLTLLQSIEAKVKLPAIVSSNMVLQRNTAVKLWGRADTKERITIQTSGLKKSITIVADAERNWSVEVKTTESKEPQSIILNSKNSRINLENILFGEVWLCSGQSKMEIPMKL